MAERDILTSTEAQEVLGRGVLDASKSNVLEVAVSAVSSRLDAHIGPVVCGTAGTITGELHCGGGAVWLRKAPVYSVTQVVEYSGLTAATLTAETNTSKPADAYMVNVRNGELVRRAGGVAALFASGRDNIYVTYICGRFATTAAVEPRYKFAAGMMLKANWRMFENAAATMGEFDIPHASFPSFSTPNAVKELLADEWRTGAGV